MNKPSTIIIGSNDYVVALDASNKRITELCGWLQETQAIELSDENTSILYNSLGNGNQPMSKQSALALKKSRSGKKIGFR